MLSLNHRRFHCLRKTGTDFLLRSCISLETTQKLGGWKAPEVMLKHYRNPSPQELDEAVTCIALTACAAGRGVRGPMFGFLYGW